TSASKPHRAQRCVAQFADQFAAPPVYPRTGMAIIVNDPDRAGLEANMAMQRELGIDVKLVSPEELADIDPNARLADDEAAAFEAEAGYVEAVQGGGSFADAARREGAGIPLGGEGRAGPTGGGKVARGGANQGR